MEDTNPPDDDHRIPYTPANTAREIGVMVGFIAAFLAVTSGYLIAWRRGNAREEIKEARRRELLREKMRSDTKSDVTSQEMVCNGDEVKRELRLLEGREETEAFIVGE